MVMGYDIIDVFISWIAQEARSYVGRVSWTCLRTMMEIVLIMTTIRRCGTRPGNCDSSCRRPLLAREWSQLLLQLLLTAAAVGC